MFVRSGSVRACAVARIAKVSAYRSPVLRTMATGGASTDAAKERRVALITGITGQVRWAAWKVHGLHSINPPLPPCQDGSYLAEFLLEKGYYVSQECVHYLPWLWNRVGAKRSCGHEEARLHVCRYTESFVDPAPSTQVELSICTRTPE